MPRLLQLLCSGIFIIFLTGCHNYYKGTSYFNEPDQQHKIDSLQKANKIFILRTPTEALAIKDLELNVKNSTISFSPGIIPEEHQLHLKMGRKGKLRFKPGKPEDVLLNEVHLYTLSNSKFNVDEVALLSMNNIYQVEVLRKDRGKSTLSHFLGFLIGVGVLFGLLIIFPPSFGIGFGPF
jgi:hypothetical protein